MLGRRPVEVGALSRPVRFVRSSSLPPPSECGDVYPAGHSGAVRSSSPPLFSEPAARNAPSPTLVAALPPQTEDEYEADAEAAAFLAI
eukprot:7804797-Pyramimonas_sp.AAC.1